MEFQKFNKIARLSRECVITEKIDGTNAQVFVTNFFKDEYIKDVKIKNNLLIDISFTDEVIDFIYYYCIAQKDNLYMFAGSRKRWITPENDNYGFARWVRENSDELFSLGIGRHYGEYWGQGVQRKYGMDKKVFSLFNTGRWADSKSQYLLKNKQEFCPKCCSVVPILYSGMFDTQEINNTLNWLKEKGSVASPSFMKPEGIVIYHTASGQMFKKTVLNDEKPKSIVK